MSTSTAAVAPTEIPSTAPPKAGMVLGTLIIVAAVANLRSGDGERRAARDL